MLDGGAGLLLVLFQHHFVAGQAHVFAFHHDLFFLRENRVDQERRRIRQLAAAQILFGDAGQQRVLQMKLAHHAQQLLTGGLEPGAIREPGLWVGECDHRRVRCSRHDHTLR